MGGGVVQVKDNLQTCFVSAIFSNNNCINCINMAGSL